MMKMIELLSLCLCISLSSFSQPILNPTGKTISTRFETPTNFIRPIYSKFSFEYYLSNFPLKPIDAKVYYYNGKQKTRTDTYASVLDIDVGNKDLQQCADAVMRLRAEYLYAYKRYKEIHFNFTNGFPAMYYKWAEGYRIRIFRNKAGWYKATGNDYSYKTFRDFLQIVFSYAGTMSLNKELVKTSVTNIKVGDVFIQGGSPGHTVIVVDVAIHKTSGKKIFLIAQSYMPAQSIHVLVNNYDRKISPWYDLSEMERMYTPEWTFEKGDLKKF